MANFLDDWRSGGSASGSFVLQGVSASGIPLVAKGVAGQTANLFECQNSAGTAVFTVDNSGNITYSGSAVIVVNETVTGNLDVYGTSRLRGAITSDVGMTVSSGGIIVTGDSVFYNKITAQSCRLAGVLSLDSGYIQTNYSANLHLLPASSCITIVGDAGTTSHSLAANDDLLVSGKLEVDGISYLDGTYVYVGTGAVQMGTADDDCGTFTMIKGAQTSDPQVQFALSADANGDFSITADTGDITLTAADDIYLVASGNLTQFSLTAGGKVYIDATSTANTQTAGVLDIDVSTATTGVNGLDVALTSTSVTGQTNYAAKVTASSSAVVTGTNQSLYAGYFTATKTGADTNAATTTVYALYAAGSNTGATDTGTKDTYGAYLTATGSASGTSTAIGVYAAASGADNNYAGVFSGSVVPLTDGGSALGTVTREWNGLCLYTGTAINWANSDVLITHAANALILSGGSFTVEDGAMQMGDADTNCSTFTMIKGAQTSDPQVQFALSADDNGNFSITADTGDITLTAADDFFVSVDGNVELGLTGTVLYPFTSDGLALGDTTHMWADLFLNTAGVINFNNGELTVTEASTGLTFAGTGMLNTVITQAAGTGAPVALTVTGGAHTAITAATEDYGVNFNFSANKTWAAGAGPLATQREVIIQAPTYIGNAGGALTITKAATLAITGAPTQGANMTLSNAYALWVQAGTAQFDGGISTTGGTFTSITVAPVATGNVLDFQLETEWTTGSVINMDFGSATTQSADMTGLYMDFNANLAGVTDLDTNGVILKTQALTQAVANTTTYTGFSIPTAGALVQSANAGTINWYGAKFQMPNITQTTGTVTSYGVHVTGGTVTSGTEYGLYLSSCDAYIDGNLMLSNGSYLGTGKTASDILYIGAYDTNTGPAYEAFITLTAGNTPTCALSGSVTGVTQSDGDNSTKLATTAYVDAAITGHDTLAEILAVGNTTGANDIVVSTAQSISTALVDDNYFMIKAVDNDPNTAVEVARAQGASDPYFSAGGTQEWKFYNSGIATVTFAGATTDAFAITAASLSTGSALVITGPSGGTAGVTDALVKIATDIGNCTDGTPTFGAISSTATIDTTGATDTGVNLFLSTANTNSTNANSSYGIYNATTDAVALANTNYGSYTSVTNTGAIDSAITKTIYGSYISAVGTGAAPTTAGTTVVYGQYITTTATHAANLGTVNQYGSYIANGTSSANGTSTKYGLYIETPTGADTNYIIYSPNFILTGAGALSGLTSISGPSIDNCIIGGSTAAAITGTTITANTGIVPDANDGAYIGTTALGFSDVFLAAGGVINWANGVVTLTESTTGLAIAGSGNNNFTWTQAAATTGTPTGFYLDFGAHTGLANAITPDFTVDSLRTVTFAGGGGAFTQLNNWFKSPIYDASLAQAITSCANMRIEPVLVGSTNVTVTNHHTVGINGIGTVNSAAGLIGAELNLLQGTVTVLGTTQVTSSPGIAGMIIGRITVSAASACTIDNAASLYIANSPLGSGAGPATLTNTYSIWVDAGNVRLDGTLGDTTNRVVSGWFTDLTVTNAIAGSVTGNAATVTVADSSSATCYVALWEGATGAQGGKSDAGATYNASTGTLSVTAITPTTLNATTLGGNLTLAAAGSIMLPAGEMASDHTWAGITETGTGGANIAIGDVLMLHTDGEWYLADANIAAAASGDARKKLGMACTTSTDGNPVTVLLWGKLRHDAFAEAMTVGAPQYVSETAGALTGTQPVTADAVIRVIGFANTDDEIFFCPSPDYITHA